MDFSKLNNKTSERLEKDIKKTMYRTAKFYGIDSKHAHFEKYLVNKAQENGIKKNLNVQAELSEKITKEIYKTQPRDSKQG
ncbi:hypothetical protein [Cardinium endosymbiont of Culicoides punctatus]|uniref:hypothetical protein n=1 Tax=Cardinium endosymbiont of Culicoides punctatus TaxID=2304601 RepID=UPI00105902A2|nr:hypothetical protein [Cardinium endosymbiont of Culicoides punctatus]TDG93371.1 hypothetical protein CCPUN_08920 [Cardinium endosymbiont of Culicoides punctatus]